MKYLTITGEILAITMIGIFVWLACMANQAFPPKPVQHISAEDRLNMEALAVQALYIEPYHE